MYLFAVDRGDMCRLLLELGLKWNKIWVHDILKNFVIFTDSTLIFTTYLCVLLKTIITQVHVFQLLTLTVVCIFHKSK